MDAELRKRLEWAKVYGQAGNAGLTYLRPLGKSLEK
jgi:hypothetical protein